MAGAWPAVVKVAVAAQGIGGGYQRLQVAESTVIINVCLTYADISFVMSDDKLWLFRSMTFKETVLLH